MCRFLMASLIALIFVFPQILPAGAQQGGSFPNRQITIVVPFGPGGATDIVARLLAVRISADLGVTLIVDNRAGGAGNIGTGAVARATPDGYTLVLATTTQLINYFMFKDQGYDFFSDLAPVAILADAPELVAVSSKVPGNTLADFIKAAKASPTGFNYGSAGIGSVPHIGGEVMAKAMGTKMVHVPFRGSADAMREVAAGNIELSLATQASVASLAETGRLKVLAVAAPKRVKTLPNVPTTAEAGLEGVELSNWFGVFAPKETDPKIISLLNAAFNKALGNPEVEATLLKQGIEPTRLTPSEFVARLQDDRKTYHEVLKELNLAFR